MINEKRMIGDYEVLTSIMIGESEVALCQNPNAPKDEVFLCGYIENNGVFERLNDCMVSNSYADIVTVFGERIAEKAEELQKELEHIGKNVGDDSELTEKDCISDSIENCIEGKVIVIRGDLLRPEYKRASNQLLLCTGGFGAQSSPRGRTCFATRLYDAKQIQCRREDILGIMPEENLPVWAKNGLEAIRMRSTQIHKNKETRGDR